MNIHTSAQGPVLALTAILSLGMSGEQTRCPARAARQLHVAAPHPVLPHVLAPAPAPDLASSWMDYIDFRRGSGDVLTRLGDRALAAALARPRHPTPDT
jgi:hypothetical protein